MTGALRLAALLIYAVLVAAAVAYIQSSEKPTYGNPKPTSGISAAPTKSAPVKKIFIESKEFMGPRSAWELFPTPTADASCRPMADGFYHASRCSSIHPLDQVRHPRYRMPVWLSNYLMPASA